MPHSPRTLERLLFFIFWLATFGLLGASAYREAHLASLHQSVRSLASDALPSIEDLTSARSHLHGVELAAIGRLTGLSFDTDLRTERTLLQDDLRAYLALPYSPGERDLWPPVQRGTEELDRALAGLQGP